MSTGPRMAIGVITLLSAFCFVLIGHFLGKELPAGPTPFYGMAAFCAAIALFCFLRRGGAIVARPGIAEGWSDERHGNWLERKQEEFRSFDVSALNALGWALLLSSFIFFIVADIVIVTSLPTNIENFTEAQTRILLFVVAIPILLLSIGWFQLGRYLLNRVGISIYRSE